MRVRGSNRVVVLALLALVALPLTVRAESPPPADKWTFAVQPYLWFPSISGTLNYTLPGGGSTASVDLNSVALDLNFAFAFDAEARKGRWGILTDFMYVDISGNDSQVKSVGFTGPGGRSVSVGANTGTSSDLKGTLWELAGFYTVAQSKTSSIDLLAGFRYLGLEANTDWNITASITDNVTGRTFARTGNISDRVDLWDGIIGVRGRVGLGSGKWGIPFYLDVGAGSSTFTFQALAGIQYRFDWIDVNLAYRYLYYDMGSDKLLQSTSLYGPILGVNFRF